MATISIDNTFGAELLGAIVSAVLYGVTSVQTYLYFVNYSNDPTRIKGMVWAIWLLDTAHVALITLCVYHYLVSSFFNHAALAQIHWSLSASVCLNLVIAVIVQSFFTHQVYTLSRGLVRWILTPLLVLLVVLHFAFGIETVAWLYIEQTFEKFSSSEHVKLAAATPFALFAVLSDIGVAASLCALLYEGRTGISKTNAMITTLMVYAVNRCILTSVVAIVEVIVFISTPNALWYLAIDFVIGKLYANSFLASLNSRNLLRAQQGTNISGPTHSSHTSSSRSGPLSSAIGSQNHHAFLALKPMDTSQNGSASADNDGVMKSYGSTGGGSEVHPDVFAV